MKLKKGKDEANEKSFDKIKEKYIRITGKIFTTLQQNEIGHFRIMKMRFTN